MRAFLILLLLNTPAFAQEKFGVVIGEKSKIVRRIVVPDRDATLVIPGFYTSKGESIIIIDRAKGAYPDVINAAIEQATGVKPSDPRTIVIDKDGMVVDVILADPELDSIPDKTLVLSPDADVGDKVDAKGAVLEKALPKPKKP